jgi:type II secretory pathway component PulF
MSIQPNFPRNNWTIDNANIPAFPDNAANQSNDANNQLMAQLVANQVKQLEDQSKRNWLQDNATTPAAFGIYAFVLSLLMLLMLEPNFVRKNKKNTQNEYELEQTRVSFIKVLLISTLVALLVYGTPILYIWMKQKKDSASQH